ncbi:solute carrier family 2, facilitated glucose transporter member 11 isoform X13 [Vulpes lagopus]|uniref:solute carrier family 2, facilitated glucose transporter member 11 isoform X13 n=1 Tax=Vulpes lagopus TaxID=494514 RepID=UPI001BCA07E3|nr:solute carrier family 2, facilitated glucose transporter member 11 isoform X13 [Vulpes lagopus]
MPTLQRLMQGRVLLLTICAAGIGGTFQFGYNLSIINAPTLHIQEFINETWRVRTGQPLPRHLVLLVWSLIVSLYPLGGLFGALLAGPLAVMLGRKKSLLVNNIFVVAAASLFGFSRRAGSFEMVILGRLLIGVSAGMGGHSSSCLSIPAHSGRSWVTHGPGPCCWPAVWCLECSNLPPSLCSLRAHATSSLTVETLRPAWQVYAVASSVFRGAGVPDAEVQYAVVGTGSCELLAACVSCVLIERVGRRVLLIAGYSLMTCWGSIFTVALCLQSSVPWMPYLAMSCIFAFIRSFGIGPAGVTGILATELFDQKSRPAAYMVCGALMWILLFLVGLGFPFIMEGLSHFFYVPFLGVCVCGAIYTAFFLPETKGKSFLEISEELDRLSFLKQNQGPDWSGPEVILSTEL